MSYNVVTGGAERPARIRAMAAAVNSSYNNNPWEVIEAAARPKRADDEDGEEGESRVIFQDNPFRIYESVRQQRLTRIYFSRLVGDPHYYTEVIHRLLTAQPQDIIFIHLNCGGGRLDTGVQLINAMKESEARVVAVLDAKAYSLATLIFLAADEFQIHDNATFMIHNYSGGTAGKGNEQVAELNATVKWFKKLAQKYYIPFLSKKELKKVLNGHDMWMDSDEVKTRLKNMVKIQQEMRELAEAEAVASTDEVDTDEVVSATAASTGGVLPEAVEVVVTPAPAKLPNKRGSRGKRKTDP